MTCDSFKLLVDLVRGVIKKQDTNWRKTVSMEEMVLC
jgi:hypothetical protein